nr:uncharacterized mitochondrial protein AtMg00810-like [Tanacetum cinerariifolium]
LTDGKSASTPIDTEKPLLKDPDGEDVDVHIYRSMFGSLMYLTSSRPDIMFVVCACACFQVTPKALHIHAVKMIFRYLKGKPHLGLWYPKDLPFGLVAYSDGDYAESQAEIYQIDLDHANKVLSMQEDETKPTEVQEVVEVVTTAKLITKVVTAASETITAASETITATDAQVPAVTRTAAPARVTAVPSRRKKEVVIMDL